MYHAKLMILLAPKTALLRAWQEPRPSLLRWDSYSVSMNAGSCPSGSGTSKVLSVIDTSV